MGSPDRRTGLLERLPRRTCAVHTRSVNVRRLKSIPLFAGLAKDELSRVADCAEAIDVEAGEHLLHEGRFAFEFFAIERGAAEVLRDGVHVADIGPGDVF